MRLLATLSTPAEGLSQLSLQFRKPRLHFGYTPHAHLSHPSLQKHGLADGLLWSYCCSPGFLRVLRSHTSSIAYTLSHTHLQLQSCPLPSPNMYSLRHFHIWLHTQLLALTFSYVQSATPTLNYNHTLTLPIRLHHRCCPPPPTLNYNHMWLNPRFCTYGIILHWHSHPLMLNSLHWDARLLVTFMHAWKHQISSFILTADCFLVFLSATQRAPTSYQGTERPAVPVECCLPRKSPWILILSLLKNVCCGCFYFST